MKKVYFTILLTLTLSLLSSNTTPVEIFCDNSYPPYSYIKNKKAAGIYTDILMIAFSRMKDYEIKITPIPWKRGLNLLKEGDGFALYPPYYYPGKRPYIDY